MDTTTRLLKNRLRQEMKARLVTMTPEEYLAYNSAIQQRFCKLPIVNNSNLVMMYFAINQEVATALLINTLLTMGKIVALPACTPDKNLRAGVIHDLNELIPGIYGLSEPEHAAPEVDPQDLDLIVVPGVAFDIRGFRLGYGAGYYDRFLAGTDAYKLGLAYDFQVVNEVPTDSYDIAVQAFLTPSKYLEICS